MRKLLIIDDDEMMLGALSYFFKEANYRVVTSSDSSLSLDLYQKHRPDVVLLDLNMPSVNGFDVLGQIRHADPDAKVVIITGYASDEVLKKASDAGAVSFYDKSLEVDVLMNQINAAVPA